MKKIEQLQEMVRVCELMNQNGFNFSKHVWDGIDILYNEMKIEWNNPPQNSLQETEYP